MDCPLCLEEIDLSDANFKPCPCGYQICRFCWHHIKQNLNGRCPACRRKYSDQTVEFKPMTAEEIKRLTQAKKQKEREKKELESMNRKHLANMRVVQKNLVYVVGLSSKLAKEELIPTLRSNEYFGQYGRISKILISKRNTRLQARHGHLRNRTRRLCHLSSQGGRCQAIVAIDGSKGSDGRIIRASYGTTKYCTTYLRNLLAPIQDAPTSTSPARRPTASPRRTSPRCVMLPRTPSTRSSPLPSASLSHLSAPTSCPMPTSSRPRYQDGLLGIRQTHFGRRSLAFFHHRRQSVPRIRHAAPLGELGVGACQKASSQKPSTPKAQKQQSTTVKARPRSSADDPSPRPSSMPTRRVNRSHRLRSPAKLSPRRRQTTLQPRSPHRHLARTRPPSRRPRGPRDRTRHFPRHPGSPKHRLHPAWAAPLHRQTLDPRRPTHESDHPKSNYQPSSMHRLSSTTCFRGAKRNLRSSSQAPSATSTTRFRASRMASFVQSAL